MNTLDTLILIFQHFDEAQRIPWRLVNSIWSDAIRFLCVRGRPAELIKSNQMLSALCVLHELKFTRAPNRQVEDALKTSIVLGRVGLVKYILFAYPDTIIERTITLNALAPKIMLKISRALMTHTKKVYYDLLNWAIIYNDLEYVTLLTSISDIVFNSSIISILNEKGSSEMKALLNKQ